jgi:AmmeMemoRadiSam system protein A
MAPLPSAESDLLLDLADAAVAGGLAGRAPVLPAVETLPLALQARQGVFATLLVDGELNGCIGNMGDVEPLAHGAARHAYAAAFEDPRLPRLRPADYDRLTIELSVLSPLAPIAAGSREELLAGAGRQGVFLPAVWEKLADPDDFLDHLLAKAGLPLRRWHPAMQAWRFTVDKYQREPRRATTGRR